MSSQGRQSPPPSESSDAQVGQAADAQGVNANTNNQQESQDQLESLSSNPTGPLDAHLKDTVKKTRDPLKDGSN